MPKRVAVVGAGVSGLTAGCLLAECGYDSTIVADEIGLQTTSGAAGAIWFPYDVEPFDAALKWALESYQTFEQLSQNRNSGVSMIELRTFSRDGTITIPAWAAGLGATRITDTVSTTHFVRQAEVQMTESPKIFSSGFSLMVPLIDTSIYLDFLAARFRVAGGKLITNRRLKQLKDIAPEFSVIVNCAGIGAGTLVSDPDLEPHRGQVVIVPKLNLSEAIVCDDAPLMYAIPRTNDCLFGGTNEVSDDRTPAAATTAAILKECSRVLGITAPEVLAARVGLRPFRRSGIRLETERLGNRTVIHNYGHGGAGFTLSWGCAGQVLRLLEASH
ncbi:MAG TPA: FAD-dependent oxidoreductase [Chthoniobacterales bacterium]|nr:FAD-dependent oxidoreductase [Chthoniobacterales bacterium]